MSSYEQLGNFYLGSELNADQTQNELVLYDAKDLTTHAVIIGMTGSGKTGLGICLLEEALLDGIPVIAVDPKGDLGNLLLTFPSLSAEQFEPYIDQGEAAQNQVSVTELAQTKADLWQKGLAKTQQSGERIQKLKDTVGMNLFTPGATFGRPLSVLKSLNAPTLAIRQDKDLYSEQIAAAATGILALLGIDNDQLSKEHILISNILENYWDQGKHLSLADLIAVIQSPPFERIGVMSIDTIYPPKERLKLAMQLNHLLASPSFEAWTQGESLNTERLLFDEAGKPQLSVMNIAHLSEDERQFFVTMLLNNILAWMRTQSGTSSLRAILYIDELFGYMPPNGNPATKTLLLTLLKQARAYGLGLVLSTQNPVDLDYKGLSNTGTWFIGKLQTEQDRNRVIDGLLSATEEGFDKKELDEAFNQLGKRKFLMHNIHDSEPAIMTTRWAMSFLCGPLSREQISVLAKQHVGSKLPVDSPTLNNAENAENVGVNHVNFPPEIEQYYLPYTQVVTNPDVLVYEAQLMALADIHYEDKKSDTHLTTTQLQITPFSDGAIAVDWRNSVNPFPQNPEQIQLISDDKPSGGSYLSPLDITLDKGIYKDWEKAFVNWSKQNNVLSLLYHEDLKAFSLADESESQFRQRITQQLRETRDAQIDKLRTSLQKRLNTLEDKLERAEIRVEKESNQASSKTMAAIIGAGTAIFSAFLSRKKVSATNARRVGSAINKAKGIFSEREDIAFAKKRVETIQEDIANLNKQFEKESLLITEKFNAKETPLKTVNLHPKSSGVHVKKFGIIWQAGIVQNDEWRAV